MREYCHRPITVSALAGLLLAVVLFHACNVMAVTGAEGIQSLGGGRYLIGETRSVPATGLNGLRLTGPQNLSGQVIINVGEADSVRFVINKVLRVGSMEIAQELDDEIQVSLRPVASLLLVNVQTPKGARWEGTNWGVRLEVMVELPSGWDLDIDTRHFEFDLNGPFRDVNIRTEFGRVKVKDVSRRLDVRGNYTGIEVEDAHGTVICRTAYSDLTVRRAIPAADEPVRLTNSYGPITVDELVGTLIAETESANFELDGMSLVGGTSRIVGDNAPVHMDLKEFGRARLEIQTSHAPVDLTVPRHLSAQLSMVVGTGGSIHTKGLTIQTHEKLLSPQRVEGVCGSGDGVIDITGSGASAVDLIGE